jgi:hypothetical protein
MTQRRPAPPAGSAPEHRLHPAAAGCLGCCLLVVLLLSAGLGLGGYALVVRGQGSGYVLLLLAGAALWTAAVAAATHGPVVLGAEGFRVRVLARWVEVAWEDVAWRQYLPLSHLVGLRRKPAGWPRLLPMPLSPLPLPAVTLPLGLRRRRDLFWEIWRRASRAQGRQVPVDGFPGPLHPPPG